MVPSRQLPASLSRPLGGYDPHSCTSRTFLLAAVGPWSLKDKFTVNTGASRGCEQGALSIPTRGGHDMTYEAGVLRLCTVLPPKAFQSLTSIIAGLSLAKMNIYKSVFN